MLPGQSAIRLAAVSDARYLVGVAYQKGNVVAKDLAAAEEWFRRAASGGHREARTKLDALVERREWAASHPGWTALTTCPGYGSVPYCRESGR